MMISFFIIKFYYGINLFTDTNILSDFNNPAVIKSMKILQVLSGGLGLFIIPAFVAAYFFDNNYFVYLQLKKRAALISFLLVVIILFASMPFINWMVEANSHLKLPAALSSLEQWMKNSEEEATRLTEAFLEGSSMTSLLTNIFIVALLPALGEELFFRGIMQKLFSQMIKNNHAAIFITSFIFSAIHLQFYGFLPRMVLGIFLGYLLVWSGSLWLPILAHFINNAAAVVFNFLAQNDKIGFNPDTVGTGADEKIMLLSSIAITFFLIYLIFKIEKRYSHRFTD
ncbi:MAG: CPBP family intramembrane glutamic endopeptidase [Bacteroidia bacterium]